MGEMLRYPVISADGTGKNIVRLCKERGITVRDLQRYFGFEAPQAIYKWRKGQSLPSVDNLYALSVLLGVHMEDILVPLRFSENGSLSDVDGDPLPFLREELCAWRFPGCSQDTTLLRVCH